MGEERTAGGATIKHHRDAAAPDTPPPPRPAYFDDIVAHLDTFLGPFDYQYDEIVSDQVHLDVLTYRPTEGRRYWTLVTCGMSSRPMAVPDGIKNRSSFERAELVICLPEDGFGHDLKQLARDGKVWPIEILKFAARFPHQYNSWLWSGHTLATEEPPEPFNARTAFCAFTIAVPLGWPKDKWNMVTHDRRSISFLTVIPLYADELKFKLENGTDALLDLFDEARVTELLDFNRPSVVPTQSPKRMFPWLNLLSPKTRK